MSWIQQNDTWLTVLALVSLGMFLASIVLVPLLTIRLPSDYFISPHKQWLLDHPAYVLILILQNLAGALLVCSGILMLILPGQGLLSIALGLSLISFPGKFRWIQRVVSRPHIHKPMNWLREKAGTSPLEIPRPRPTTTQRPKDD